MARSLNIETLIEDAFLTEIPNYVDSGVSVIRWEDIKTKTLTECVKIKAVITETQEGTLNLYCAHNVLVDFGIFTSKRIDEDGKAANAIRAGVRDLINQDNIVALLNAEAGLAVYPNGVIPRESTDVSDDKLYHKVLQVLVVATTEEET